MSDPATTEEDPEPRVPEASPPRVGRLLRAGAVTLLVLLGACFGGAVVLAVVDSFGEPEEPPAETTVVEPTADVIVAVRDLARLESAEYHVERVIDMTSRQRRLFGLVQAEDSILLVAAADVVAGVDLGEMRDGDVTIEPESHRATVTLPPARVFSARLDNDRTYVHDRDTDLLAHRRESLETNARREAEQTLEQAAIEAGILTRAERNAARTVSTLVRSLGYEEVEVRFREEP